MKIKPSEVSLLSKIIHERIKASTEHLGDESNKDNIDTEEYNNLIEEKARLESLDKRFDDAIEEIFERILEQGVEI